MSEIISAVVGVLCVLCGIGITVIAIQLCRGKWYRLIAGNSNADEKTIDEQKSQGLGRGVGIVLFIAAFMVFAIAGVVFSRVEF